MNDSAALAADETFTTQSLVSHEDIKNFFPHLDIDMNRAIVEGFFEPDHQMDVEESVDVDAFLSFISAAARVEVGAGRTGSEDCESISQVQEDTSMMDVDHDNNTQPHPHKPSSSTQTQNDPSPTPSSNPIKDRTNFYPASHH